MKKIFLFITVLFLVVVFALPASTSAATNAGVKPGSFFYFFDTAFEKVNLFFTFNPEKKARKALEYADERLAEAETFTESKDSNMVKTVMENYTANIALAAKKSKEVKDKQASENLLSTIADNTSKHQEILSDVLNKVPDEAKEAITKAIEASRKGQEEAAKQIAELKGEVEQLKKEVAELKEKQSVSQPAPKQPTPINQISQEKEKAKNDPKSVLITQFLKNPTLENFKVFCVSVKNVQGFFLTKQALDNKKEKMVTVKASLYEELPHCQELETLAKDSNLFIVYLPIDNDTLIPLNDDDQDWLREGKVRFNTTIKDFLQKKNKFVAVQVLNIGLFEAFKNNTIVKSPITLFNYYISEVIKYQQELDSLIQSSLNVSEEIKIGVENEIKNKKSLIRSAQQYSLSEISEKMTSPADTLRRLLSNDSTF